MGRKMVISWDNTTVAKKETKNKQSTHNITLKTKARVTRTLQQLVGWIQLLQKGKQLLFN